MLSLWRTIFRPDWTIVTLPSTATRIRRRLSIGCGRFRPAMERHLLRRRSADGDSPALRSDKTRNLRCLDWLCRLCHGQMCKAHWNRSTLNGDNSKLQLRIQRRLPFTFPGRAASNLHRATARLFKVLKSGKLGIVKKCSTGKYHVCKIDRTLYSCHFYGWLLYLFQALNFVCIEHCACKIKKENSELHRKFIPRFNITTICTVIPPYTYRIRFQHLAE